MNIEARQKLAKQIFEDALSVLKGKGIAYSGENDSLSNFKITAELLDKTPFEIWSIYFAKHVLAILNAIKTNPVEPTDYTEGLYGRVLDIINYAIILIALIEELNEGENNDCRRNNCQLS